jgi:hypothetical protein
MALQLPLPQAPCDGRFLLVGNIPWSWSVADVRGFFANAVEAGWFQLFHYKQRPQPPDAVTLPSTLPPLDAAGAADTRPRCCVARVKDEFVGNVTRMYSDKNVSRSRLVGSLRRPRGRVRPQLLRLTCLTCRLSHA